MPRHKEFDRDAVLDRAVDVFWERGYGATSVQDLVDAMGIQRGSLYNEFGDKRALFLAALDRYERVRVDCVVDSLRSPGPLRAKIRRVFEQVVRADEECGVRRGCLATNAAVELAPLDPRAAARASAVLAHMEQAFHDVLFQARERGELPPDSPVRRLARFLTGTLQGLRVMSRVGASREALEDVVEVALRALA